MDERDTHLRALLTILSGLSWRKQVSFGLLVFERLLPGLTAFSKGTGVDISCYLKARDVIWSILQNGSDRAVNPSLKDDCQRNIPDTESFSDDRTSDALNAALTMSEILDFMHDHESEHISYLASLSLDSAEFHASRLLEPFNSYTPEIESKLANHAFVQQEVRSQKADLEFLAGLPDEFDGQTLATLKARLSAQPSH